MKKRQLFFALAIMSLTFINLQAQDIKLGYLAVERVIVLMPEMEGVQSELADFENQLASQIQVKAQTLQDKLAAYQKVVATLTDTDKLERERELESLNTDLQKFRGEAQQAVSEKEARLLQPVYQRIQGAIDSVSKANGFTQIFRAETLLFNSNATDIFSLVAEELQLKIPEPKEADQQ